MKKLLIIFCVIGCFFSPTICKANATFKPGHELSIWFKHIHFEVTVSGVTVTVDGDINYNMFSGNYTFTGCVDLHGQGLNIHQCNVTVHGHVGSRTGYDWGTGDPDAESILNSDDFLSPFEEYIVENA
jgi:hypothetical protein